MSGRWGLEFKNFLASRGVVAGLVLMALAGVYAMEQGRVTIARQRAVLAGAGERESAERARLLARTGRAPADGPGGILYDLMFHTRRDPSAFAPVAVGLRDVQSYNLKVRLLALEGQLYDAETGNPEAQALGCFDLTFLLVFLYPLLLIGLLHNTLSAEMESGTWAMIGASAVSRTRVLWEKAAVRFVLVPAVWLATCAAAVVRLGLPVDARLAVWVGVSLLYLLFWFGLAMVVAGWRRSSNFNALVLLSAWLVLTILVPVAVNVAIAARLPASSAFEIALRQREGYHSKWDRPREETLQAFYKRYPEYAASKVPLDKFSWGWYYAMQQMGDEEAAAAARVWQQTMRNREEWASRMGALSPAALVQSAMTQVAGTGLRTHLEYLDSVRAYHERLRRLFYGFLFHEEPVPVVDWEGLPGHRFVDDWRMPAELGVLAMLVVGVMAGAGYSTSRSGDSR